MLGADFLQNHIRHFYLFSIPDFVKMPERPPFWTNLTDARLNKRDNEALVGIISDSIKASQESHQILSFWGQSSSPAQLCSRRVSVPVTSDNVN